MELPERIWITEGRVKSLTCGVYWTSPAECPVEDDVEYIRAEAVKCLVEAAKEALELMLTDSTCFGLGVCKYYTECTRPDGECQFVLRLQAALAAVEG